jgi:hypothetical protein
MDFANGKPNTFLSWHHRAGMQAQLLQRRHSCTGDEQEEFLRPPPPLKRFGLQTPFFPPSPLFETYVFKLEDKLFKALILTQNQSAFSHGVCPSAPFSHGGLWSSTLCWMREQGPDGVREHAGTGKPWSQ